MGPISHSSASHPLSLWYNDYVLLTKTSTIEILLTGRKSSGHHTTPNVTGTRHSVMPRRILKFSSEQVKIRVVFIPPIQSWSSNNTDKYNVFFKIIVCKIFYKPIFSTLNSKVTSLEIVTVNNQSSKIYIVD